MKFTRRELLKRLRTAIKPYEDISYAIGGSTAMAAHGYSRFTNDIDVFILEEHLNLFMRALRAVDLDLFAISEPSHYAAKLPGDPNPERRIDILVPFGEPELSAIEYPVLRWGFKIFAPDLLAMSKFYSFDDSGDPKHAFDLLAMYRHGIFDPKTVKEMIYSIDPERIDSWDRLLQSFKISRRQIKLQRSSRRLFYKK